ncbi:unnamed protein product [Rotaria sp. Silwood2]|nr:unnamed protein product [Rotaria sp. Silwood2]CAF3055402.1 unnamed protein product [Rotaria sp. Silwood2]CAF3591313.1 unnamed protein product [Rotaria sp. Silwood2]CAF4173943.1 unnamed protein product [Rotaria sp. Silwood2]CAF4585957.1 unnamed protein product [Rotaria sp. Silwood2]
MDRSFKPLDHDDQELFQRHAKGIDKKVRETFPSIPSGFTLKPVTIRKTVGCGMFYDFMIALPDSQFAKVSFHTGGHPGGRPAGGKEPEQHFDVDPTPSSSQYMTD